MFMPRAAGMTLVDPSKFTDTLDSLSGFTASSSGSGVTINAGVLEWTGTTDGQAILKYNTNARTTNQYGAAITSSMTGNGSGIILHCDSGNTGYYGAVFYNTYIKLIRTSGRWTQNTITQIATYNMTITSGDLIEFWNIGNVFNIAVNGTTYISQTISNPVVGPLNMFQGMGLYHVSFTNSTSIAEWRGGDASAWGKLS